MEGISNLKVAKTSRAAIDSISNSKEEFSALIAKIDTKVGDMSQLVRISKNAANSSEVGQINKLKIHRKRLNDMLMKMEIMQDRTWELLRPEAARIYEEAAMEIQ
jgi:hypothetical protein